MNGAEHPRAPMTPLAREALDWVVRLHSGAATHEDARALGQWRARSAEHEEAFREAVRVRRGLQGLLEAREDEKVVALRRRQNAFSRRAFMAGGGALAASIVGGVMIARPPLDLWPSYAELMADYRTGPGERQVVRSIAGVSIDMNTRTSISNRSDGGIDLIAGEVFVTVDREASFRAGAGDGEALARQAAFNFRHVDGEVCVTCVEGEVAVTNGRQHATLGSGQQLLFSPAGFGTAEQANMTVATAWRSGQLIFTGEPLSKVVAEVNRYRSGRIVLRDTMLARKPVSAVFHLDQMANAVTQIEQLTGVRGTHLPGGIVVIG